MKIALDNIIYSLQKSGGISKVWTKILEIFLNKEDLSFYFVENNYRNNIFSSTLDFADLPSKKSNRIPNSIKKFLPVYLKNEVDIYHSSYYRPLSRKNNTKTKVVVTVHDFIYDKYEINWVKRKLHIFLMKRALYQADAIICISNNTKMDLLQYYPELKKKRIFIVSNGVDEEFRSIEEITKIEVKGTSIESKKFLLYVGNRGYCKNFDFVVSLFKSKRFIDKGFKLVLVGGGDLSKDELRKFEVSNLKCGNIIKLEKINNQDLNILYNNALALLFPSFYEGFGIPALEAAKAGCPVWASNSSSIPEILGPNYNYFNPHNWKDAEKKFSKILDVKERDKLIEEGKFRAQMFSWEKCANETLDVYKIVLDGR
ncbi:glycosyltransferase family 1 protein [Christiangramia sp. OXR-203]|uniref:glycosyltransferase family 4 protein n=1 Tax=Christiangramia sp. OXR-203 TaxID=3100176 RepID=UPI002AC8A9BC|nr:glycosyltransferase family 1 protein [Christiangramia sp. OXR-203]WPY98252.1 glycosyltransferase family 1 protein [Christiangramia sp. OXR-203]